MKNISIAFCFWLSIGFAMNNPFVQMPTSPSIQGYIPIHYADAGYLSQSLNSRQLDLLSPTGKAYADTRSNQLYIKDDASHFQNIRKYIQKMDVPLSQVLISAKLVSVDNHYIQDLGVLFKSENISNNPDKSLGLSENKAINIPILNFSNSNLLNLQIHALEEEGHATVLSKPEIIALNRQSATIESGDEIPYQESTSSGATNVTFKKAVLKLNVKPIILPKNHLLLQIQINEDKVGSLSVNGVPSIRTEQLNTIAMMRSGETVILGGIFETTQAKTRQAIPGLNKIPILGQFLSRKRLNMERTELLIFIKPKILISQTP